MGKKNALKLGNGSTIMFLECGEEDIRGLEAFTPLLVDEVPLLSDEEWEVLRLYIKDAEVHDG